MVAAAKCLALNHRATLTSSAMQRGRTRVE